MAIATNKSEEDVVGGINLYYGIAPMQVVAINPTLDELNSLGVNTKRDPEYAIELSGEKYTKLSFWVRHASPDITTRVEILMKDTPRTSKDGSKFMWVNNRGQITWCEDNPSSKYDWFKAEGERKAYSGEDVLLNFIKAWGNVSSNGDCYLETIDKIVKGDVTELKKLVDALQDNRVRILLGVKDGKYQQTYTKHFGRLKPQRNDMFTKELNSDYGGFNSAYPEDLRLAPYTEKLVAPSEVATVDDSDDWVL
jgi:hypothetical protein